MEGRILVPSLATVPRTCIVPLAHGRLRTPPIFNGSVAIPPGKAAQFSVFWFPQGAGGEMVFEELPPTLTPDGLCFGPIPFEVEVRVQIFERVQPVRFRSTPFTRVFCVKDADPALEAGPGTDRIPTP